MPSPKKFPMRTGPDGCKAANWFSTRHKTSTPNREAREMWQDRVEQKYYDKTQREKYRASIGPGKQLRRLDERLGIGVGAKKERERLHAAMSSRKKAPKA